MKMNTIFIALDNIVSRLLCHTKFIIHRKFIYIVMCVNMIIYNFNVIIIIIIIIVVVS